MASEPVCALAISDGVEYVFRMSSLFQAHGFLCLLLTESDLEAG